MTIRWIEKVSVRITCSPSPYGYPVCDDEKCEKCKGAGSYVTELDWRDFMAAVREELRPMEET